MQNKSQDFLHRINDRFLRLLLLITSDPFKVAELWRKRGMIIGDKTCIYRDVIFGCSGRDPITIGQNCVLTGCTILGHDASTNRKLGFKYGEPSILEPVVIEDECFIGYGSIVLMGVRIGRGSIIAAGSIVTTSVPPNSVVAGNPGRVICSVDDLVAKRIELFRIRPEFFPTIPKIINE